MTRNARLASAVLLLSLTLGLTACGDAQSTEPAAATSSSTPPASSSASRTSAQPTEEPVGDPGDYDPNLATKPEQLAVHFAQAAMGNITSLQSADREAAILNSGAFLRGSMWDAVRTAPVEHAWRFLPFGGGSFTGRTGTIVDARSQATSYRVLRTGTTTTGDEEATEVEVVVDFAWTYDDGTSLYGTRTYTLAMVAGEDRNDGGFAWQVLGGQGEDSPLTDTAPEGHTFA